MRKYTVSHLNEHLHHWIVGKSSIKKFAWRNQELNVTEDGKFSKTLDNL